MLEATTEEFEDAFAFIARLEREREVDRWRRDPLEIQRRFARLFFQGSESLHEWGRLFSAIGWRIVGGARATRKTAERIERLKAVVDNFTAGNRLKPLSPYAFLAWFDVDDLQDFKRELDAAFEEFKGSPEVWEEVDAVVFEWIESAAILGSGVLDRYLGAKS